MRTTESSLFRQQAFIAGHWCDADNHATVTVTDPATGQPLGQVPDMGEAETRRAITAAHGALPAWRARPAQERSHILRRWFDLMIQHEAELAHLMTREQGKPLAEALGEIRYAASFLEWFAEEGKRVYGELIPAPRADRRLMVLRQGIGVCAAITPWNFPAAMITRKVAPALAAGCTMVLKPANETPFSALALAELAAQAGVPDGVFNIVTGDAVAIGGELTRHPDVRKLSFTGSTAVGRLLMAQCAPTIKKLSLELGGNAPFIVFDDADLDAAVEGAIAAKYRNAGQTCVCVNRIYVQDAVYDAFARRFADQAATLRVGPGLQADSQIGPLITPKALTQVQGLVDDARAQGARLLTGGDPHVLGGTFMAPTVLADVRPGMRVLREEIFGPVAPLVRFRDEQDVIRQANDTEFGLAAYFYTRDASRVWRVAEQLEYGMVGINTGMISNEVAPFGGVKQSGLGREGSRHGIEDYLEMKYVCQAV
ncbi:Succinate-semialdehyde dehydrogenase [NADP(+)] GabD [Achromobacter deleyi]|uniref:Succinate-semialdehyde dehydrogenase [NADP(+)] GabD n=2 Tax=Burkholderiales TaxID=80840 RepID=A0A6S6ZEQ0_9BURK|nr:NAD-dependent succinate-semialdehyde dehydrogenase [Achromobacter deleyi]CAB3675003.1 Succinate-semialdehyde dehydrogenase [NADP(+)] GabD [Achromobacter deleyi]CAB3837539.1 Succinate-semialdehyde dehydrogenase [NADP(+)] GabD [Achromobacter deleyi]CAB3842422.1 Succinate-semialdehyde dehydrogenase [NADP(+)] GabD [Achromobacter deleyi]CAB3874114.1 Succinate-semialdehyde dehydrogenase [NADP(+)] GabD [Achromobacter deleyi]